VRSRFSTAVLQHMLHEVVILMQAVR